jgi:AraC family transcriptional regulator
MIKWRSLANNKTGDLWRQFMPVRKNITHHLTNELISMQVYPPSHFSDFKPTNEFEKWAAVEVADFDNVPDEMETVVLPGGLYAVFEYKGAYTMTRGLVVG